MVGCHASARRRRPLRICQSAGWPLRNSAARLLEWFIRNFVSTRDSQLVRRLVSWGHFISPLQKYFDTMSTIVNKLYNTGLGWFNDILDVRVYFSADLRDPNQTATASLPPDEEAAEDDGVFTAEVPLFVAGAAVEGFIRITAPPGRSVSHNGVTAILRSAAVSVDEDVNRELLLEEVDLVPAGKLSGTVDLPFVFPGSITAMLPDTVEGALFSIRNTVSVTVSRPWYTFEVKREAGFGIQRIFDMAPRCSYVVQISSAGETTADVLAEVEGDVAAGDTPAAAAAAAGGPPTAAVAGHPEAPHTGASKTEPAGKSLALASAGGSAASKMNAQLALYGPQAALIADMDDGSAVQLVFDKGCYEITEKLSGSLVFEGVTTPIVLVRLAVLRVEYCNGDTSDEVIFDETILDARRWRERKNALRGLMPPVAPGKSSGGLGRKGKGTSGQGRGPALSSGSAGDAADGGFPRAKVVPTAGDGEGAEDDADADGSTVRLSSIGAGSDSSSVGQISALAASASVSSSARGSFDASGAALAAKSAADDHHHDDHDDAEDDAHEDGYADEEEEVDEEDEMETAEDEHSGIGGVRAHAHPIAAAAAARPRRGKGRAAGAGGRAAGGAAAGGRKGGVRLKYADDGHGDADADADADVEAGEGDGDEEAAEGEEGEGDADVDADEAGADEEEEGEEGEEESWYPSPEDLEGHSGAGDGSDVDPDVPIIGDVSLSVELEFGHIAGVAPTLVLKLPPPGTHINDAPDATAAAAAAGRARAGSSGGGAAAGGKLVSTVDDGLVEDASVRFFVRLTVYTAFTPGAKRWATREVILFRERLYGTPAPEGMTPEPLYASAGALSAAAAAAAAGAGAAGDGVSGRTANPLARSAGGAAAAAGGAGAGAGVGLPPRKVLPLALGASGDFVGDGGATSPKLSPGVGAVIGGDAAAMSARGLGPAAAAGRAISPMHAVGAPAAGSGALAGGSASSSARAGSPVKAAGTGAGVAAGGGSPGSAGATARGRVPSAPLDDGDLETLEGGMASSPPSDAGALGPTVVVAGGASV